MSKLSAWKPTRLRRNLVFTLRSNAVAQVITFASAPALSRLYSPHAFGEITIIFTTAAVIISFATLRFEWSIPNTKTNRESRVLATTSSILLVLVALVAPMIARAFCEAFDFIIAKKAIDSSSIWITVAVVLVGAQNIIGSICVKSGDLRAVGDAKIAESIAQSLLSITLGFFESIRSGLLVAKTIGLFIWNFWVIKKDEFVVRQIKGEPIADEYREPTWSIKEVIRKHLPEAFVSTSVSIINSAFLHAFPLLIISTYSIRELGLVALATKFASAPAQLISSAVGKSFWSEASILIKSNARLLQKKYLKLTVLLVGASIPFILILLLGPHYFALIFGDQWGEAGAILAALSPKVFATLVFGSTNHLIIYGKQHYQLFSDILGVLLAVLVVVAAKQFAYSLSTTVWLLSTSALISYLIRFALHIHAYNQVQNTLNDI